MMGIKLLLQAGKGYSHTYNHVEKNIKYPAILVDGRCAITPWGQKLRIGGTMEISGINNKVMLNRMQGIYNSAKDFYPGLKIDFPPADKIWYGLDRLRRMDFPILEELLLIKMLLSQAATKICMSRIVMSMIFPFLQDMMVNAML